MESTFTSSHKVPTFSSETNTPTHWWKSHQAQFWAQHLAYGHISMQAGGTHGSNHQPPLTTNIQNHSSCGKVIFFLNFYPITHYILTLHIGCVDAGPRLSDSEQTTYYKSQLLIWQRWRAWGGYYRNIPSPAWQHRAVVCHQRRKTR